MGAQDLTTATTVAGDLGVSATDPALVRLVTAASKTVARILGRGDLFYESGIVENVPGYGRPYLSLKRRPVISITSIALGGAPFDPSSDFLIEDADAGLVLRVGGIWPATGLLRGGIVEEELAMATADGQGYVVTYEAGWVTPGQAVTGWSGPPRSLPEDIEEATIQIVSNLYRARGADANIIAESLGDASITYHQVRKALPDSALSLLAPYVQVLP